MSMLKLSWQLKIELAKLATAQFTSISKFEENKTDTQKQAHAYNTCLILIYTHWNSHGPYGIMHCTEILLVLSV